MRAILLVFLLSIGGSTFAQDGEGVVDEGAKRISDAARESLKDSVNQSVDRIVVAISQGSSGTKAVAAAASIPTTVVQPGSSLPSMVALTKLPNKPGYGVGMVRSPKPGGWVVFKSTSVGFEFVTTILLEGDAENGYKSCAFQEVPGVYGVLFMEKGVTQPQVINVAIGGVNPIPPDPDPDPDPVPVPDTKFGLTKFTKELLAKLTDAERNREVSVVMPDGNTIKTTAVAAVGAVYYDIAQRVKSGSIDSVAGIGPELSKMTRTVLEQPPGEGNWPQVVIIPLGLRANNLWQSPGDDEPIRNINDWSAALMEIHEGFK